MTFAPLGRHIAGTTLPAYERLVGSAVFESVPFHGNIRHDEEGKETGLYFVTCTGSHYEYYDKDEGRFYHIDRV